MDLAFKTPHFFLSLRFGKCRKAVGVSSMVKGNPKMHHLFFDIDSKDSKPIKWVFDRYLIKSYYNTPHGTHLIIDSHFSLNECASKLLECPFIDVDWIALALKRGYFFLETYCDISEDILDLTFMEIDRVANT